MVDPHGPAATIALERRQTRAREKNGHSFFEECSQKDNWAGCTAGKLEEGFAEILVEFQNCERPSSGISDDHYVVRLFEKGPSAAGLGAFHRKEWSKVIATEIEPVLDGVWRSFVEHHEFWSADRALRVALESEEFDHGEFISESRTYLESDEFLTAVRLVYDNARRKNRRPSSGNN